MDGLAADRDVIVFDYPGIGRSTGTTADSVDELALDCIELLRALNLTTVDILGVSPGGMVAQQIASTHPELVRRIILCGTGPRGGENMTFTELSIDELSDPEGLLLYSFFTPSDTGQAAGREYLARLASRAADRDTPVSMSSAAAQLRTIRQWGEIPNSGRYAMLEAIAHPTLIVYGNHDIGVDPINATILGLRLPDTVLLMLPDSSHGAQSQWAELFLANARWFLNR